MDLIGPNFAKELVTGMLSMYDKVLRGAYHWLWDLFMSIIKEHWVLILIVLSIFLIISIFIALDGSWGFFGSLMYNYLYFGILFVIGLVKGPEVFLSEYFEFFCLLLLYPVCYRIVGMILNKFDL